MKKECSIQMHAPSDAQIHSDAPLGSPVAIRRFRCFGGGAEATNS